LSGLDLSPSETETEDDDEIGDKTEGSKIAKPPGEAGRKNSGGYNLKEALGWESKRWREFTVSLLTNPYIAIQQ
jgi:hypothetical protein